MKILKFGGTSIGSVEDIRKVLNIVANTRKQDKNLVIVVSAFGGVTNKLVSLANNATSGVKYTADFDALEKHHRDIIKALLRGARAKRASTYSNTQFKNLKNILLGVSLTGELSLRTLDTVMSFGEILSSYIICEALSEHKIPCKHTDTRTLIRTNSCFGNAKVSKKKSNKLITDYFKNKKGIHVIGGFIAQDEDGVTTTLGRSGSDYTAAILGAALRASVVEIWTDVDGVMSSDPSKVPDAFSLMNISYTEASELAYFGAKVIHVKTMIPTQLKKIPIHIKNTFNPEASGTVITHNKINSRHHVKSVSSMRDIALFRIQGNSTRIITDIVTRTFDCLAEHNIDAVLTTQASADPSLCIAIKDVDVKRAQALLTDTFALEIQTKNIQKISVEEDKIIIAIIGQKMKGVPGIAGKMFDALGKYGINISAIAQGTSELSISAVINKEDELRALNVLHSEFFAHKAKPANTFVVGTGLIGGTMLNQISKTKAQLEDKYGVRVRICGIANVDNMLINTHGLELKDWEKNLTLGVASNLNDFVKEMQDMKLPNKVFVDCTASEHITREYSSILDSKISIVTPNKKAMSGTYKTYKELGEVAKRHDCRFIYETNVGAALPVISTLKDLAHNGDSITKIEAVLSGTLSYIFNTFSSTDKKFSDIVKIAKEKGFTEPDPRDDLNGMDVARKILILARESGATLEMSNIKMKPVLSKKCFLAKNISAFFKELKKEDEAFENLRAKLRKSGKVLRYIATFEFRDGSSAEQAGKVEVELKEVDSTHPFFNIRGNDNIVSIHTKRYCDTPIVIKGPGAGAEVTAGGVFADIVKTVA